VNVTKEKKEKEKIEEGKKKKMSLKIIK